MHGCATTDCLVIDMRIAQSWLDGGCAGADRRCISHRLERTVTILDIGRLAVIVATPTLIGAVVVTAPRWCGYIADRWARRHADDPVPIGPPIEQLAVDLRRLLRLHGELTASAHLAMRAHRLWAVEAAIAVRAVEAARALDVPHPEPEHPGTLNRTELRDLIHDLGEAGLVLPSKVGPFIGDGHF